MMDPKGIVQLFYFGGVDTGLERRNSGPATD